MKIVINRCYGGFGLSDIAMNMLKEIKNYGNFNIWDISRTDKDLIDIVEKLGEKANGIHSKLKIITIPDLIDYEITEYDGYETVEEVHRTWH